MDSSLPMYLTGASNAHVRRIARQANIGLLVRPGNSYVTHTPDYAAWAADNGQYTTKPGSAPTDEEWFEWLTASVRLARASGAGPCLFATAPDVLKVIEVDGKPVVIGDAQATLERSRPWLARIRELGIPAALVAQDGVEDLEIPWGEFDVLFLGGSTEWKIGPGAERLTREAKARGVRVHMGRVNSGKRLKIAGSWGVDTADGTFLAFGPEKNLVRLLAWYGMTPEQFEETPEPEPTPPSSPVRHRPIITRPAIRPVRPVTRPLPRSLPRAELGVDARTRVGYIPSVGATTTQEDTMTKSLAGLTTDELNRKATAARNRRDRFSHGSPHADEAVQELAKVERELRRRRELKGQLYQAERELEAMMERPYASACGEADAVSDRIDALRAELGTEA